MEVIMNNKQKIFSELPRIILISSFFFMLLFCCSKLSKISSSNKIPATTTEGNEIMDRIMALERDNKYLLNRIGNNHNTTSPHLVTLGSQNIFQFMKNDGDYNKNSYHKIFNDIECVAGITNTKAKADDVNQCISEMLKMYDSEYKYAPCNSYIKGFYKQILLEKATQLYLVNSASDIKYLVKKGNSYVLSDKLKDIFDKYVDKTFKNSSINQIEHSLYKLLFSNSGIPIDCIGRTLRLLSELNFVKTHNTLL